MSSKPLIRKKFFPVFAIATTIVYQCMVSIALTEEKPIEDAPSDAQQPTATPLATADTAPSTETTPESEPGEPQPSVQPAPQDATSDPESEPGKPQSSVQPAPQNATSEAEPSTLAVVPPPIQPDTKPFVSPVPAGQKHFGFALELFLGVTKPLAAMDEDFVDVNSVNGGLFLGGKVKRVIIGLGFEMSRITYRRKYGTDYYNDYDGEYKESITKLMFKPGVRFVIVQSDDQKVDMFGQIDIGAGTLLFKEEEDDYDYESDNEKYFLLDWNTALGVRYWAHPQFAVSATGGLLGNYFLRKDDDTDSRFSYHTIGFVSTLQLLGVF